jgi:hypothetical protein
MTRCNQTSSPRGASRLRSNITLALSLACCGPEPTVAAEGDGSEAGTSAGDGDDWMLGTFSSAFPGLTGHTSGLTKYRVHADHRLERIGVGGCGDNTELAVEEYRWESLADDVIEIELPDNGSGTAAWRVSPGPTCDTLHFETVTRRGQVFGPDLMQRGEICMSDLPPCTPDQVECDSCGTYWCDEPWPECDGGGSSSGQ